MPDGAYRVRSRYETYVKGKKVTRRRGVIIPAAEAAQIPNLLTLEKSGYLEKIPDTETGVDET